MSNTVNFKITSSTFKITLITPINYTSQSTTIYSSNLNILDYSNVTLAPNLTPNSTPDINTLAGYFLSRIMSEDSIFKHLSDAPENTENFNYTEVEGQNMFRRQPSIVVQNNPKSSEIRCQNIKDKNKKKKNEVFLKHMQNQDFNKIEDTLNNVMTDLACENKKQNALNMALIKQSNDNNLLLLEKIASFFAKPANNVNNDTTQVQEIVLNDDLFTPEEADEYERARVTKSLNERPNSETNTINSECNQFEPCGTCFKCIGSTKSYSSDNKQNVVTLDRFIRELSIHDKRIQQLSETVETLNTKISFFLESNDNFPSIKSNPKAAELPWNVVTSKNKKAPKIIETTQPIGLPSINKATVKMMRPQKPPFNLIPEDIIQKQKEQKETTPKKIYKPPAMNEYIDENVYEQRVVETMRKVSLHISFALANDTIIEDFTRKVKDELKVPQNEAKEMTIRNLVDCFFKNDLKISKDIQKQIEVKHMSENKLKNKLGINRSFITIKLVDEESASKIRSHYVNLKKEDDKIIEHTPREATER